MYYLFITFKVYLCLEKNYMERSNMKTEQLVVYFHFSFCSGCFNNPVKTNLKTVVADDDYNDFSPCRSYRVLSRRRSFGLLGKRVILLHRV